MHSFPSVPHNSPLFNLLNGIINMPSLNNSSISGSKIKSGVNYIENNISTLFNNTISDIEGAFSGVGSFFSDLKIDIGGSCN